MKTTVLFLISAIVFTSYQRQPTRFPGTDPNKAGLPVEGIDGYRRNQRPMHFYQQPGSQVAWQHADNEALPPIWDKWDRSGQAWCWFTNSRGEYVFVYVGQKEIVSNKPTAFQTKNEQGHILYVYATVKRQKAQQ